MSISTLLLILSLPVAGAAGFLARAYIGRVKLTSAEARAHRLVQDAVRDAEAKRKELLIEAKDQLLKEKNLFEKEMRERRQELQGIEKRLVQKEESLDGKSDQLEKREKALQARELENQEKEEELNRQQERHKKELERISGLTTEEAKQLLLKNLENEVRFESIKLINKIEEEAKRTAEKKAKEVVLSAIQRNASDFTSECTITTVSLPSDDMKGRIIGREGRNIRTLENLTGVDMIIDDTPEVVVISGFDPVRREIARLSLERLIQNGRIHPARIEEVVEKVTQELEENMLEEGEKAAFELGIPGLSREALYHVGKLRYRSSYGQNVLSHSKEVANLAGIMAGELQLDVMLAKRSGLLHDIGKGSIVEGEGAHAVVGAEMARKFGESEKVLNIIASHHFDKEPESFEAVLIQVADAISASRPGARRESLDTYIKRLENLEAIASGFKGVDKCYAIQAGRELRVLVANDLVTDERAEILAREIAQKIESELKYPGIVRVTVIRETRIVEYAK
ncbi:MAG TPA: ribonuclease Y [Spirochaetota bacterium]|jgi:ribonuclease Y|nr:ribonuclease Y [Spirochaetota bacterium]OPZ36405.1 MAG: Ribonuclease Y [Spirochaetes bacterium ADurb.BinA120]HNU90845.1 ribonuclease Y [Spirochaetota bacterium]HPV97199.1 ribonuclease Y [Spirochaetota bacterium]